MSARAVLAHQLAGRVRLSVASRRGDALYFEQLAERFAATEDVRQVKVNPVTGTMLLEFDGEFGDVMRRAGAGDLLAIDAALPGPARRAMPELFARPVSLVSGRAINPMFMAGFAFAVMGVAQALRGRIAVPAATAFWYSTSTFLQAGVVSAIDSVEKEVAAK